LLKQFQIVPDIRESKCQNARLVAEALVPSAAVFLRVALN
jgi:hypothetical protein